VLDQREVLREILALKARVAAAPVVGRQIVDRAEASGDEAATERAVGDERDAEVLQRRQQLSSGSRLHKEYSVCTAAIECTLLARRRLSIEGSDSPRCFTLPACTNLDIAPIVSSIGTFGSTRCGE
jgi:hypothetical protein